MNLLRVSRTKASSGGAPDKCKAGGANGEGCQTTTSSNVNVANPSYFLKSDDVSVTVAGCKASSTAGYHLHVMRDPISSKQRGIHATDLNFRSSGTPDLSLMSTPVNRANDSRANHRNASTCTAA